MTNGLIVTVNFRWQVFTSEDVELPRTDVANFLAAKDPNLCARYIEYLLDERHETDTAFHNRLAEIYLELTLSAKKRGNEGTAP